EGRGLKDARRLVVPEEESPVASVVDLRNNDGAANRGAELVLAEPTLCQAAGVLEEVGGVELIVSDELPGRAVHPVRARLDGGVQHGATGASQLGTEVAGLNLELLDGVDGWADDVVGAATTVVEVW